jgi:hypothetical protein
LIRDHVAAEGNRRAARQTFHHDREEITACATGGKAAAKAWHRHTIRVERRASTQATGSRNANATRAMQ